MTKPITLKEQANKIVVSGEGFILLKQLKAKIDQVNKRIEKANDVIQEGKELTDNQKAILEGLKQDVLLFETLYDIFNDIIVENSYLIVYLQKMAIDMENAFPGEIKKILMPSQIKVLSDMKEIFGSVKEIFDKYNN